MKTAGTSIETYLSPYLGKSDVLTPTNPPEKRHQPKNYKGYWNILRELRENNFRDVRRIFRAFWRRKKYYEHMPARHIKRRVGDKVWKDYFVFCVERDSWEKVASYYAMIKRRGRYDKSFDEFLESPRLKKLKADKFCSIAHEPLVDQIVHFENLEEELGEVFAKLGIPFENGLNVKAKKNPHKKKTKSYKSTYNTKQKEKVARLFDYEIKTFDYKF